MRIVMSKFWKEHLAQAREIEMMGEEPVGLFHGMLIEGDDTIRELEERLAARGELLQSTAARIAELEAAMDKVLALIDATPHSSGCWAGMLVGDGPQTWKCNCWKSALDTGAKG